MRMAVPLCLVFNILIFAATSHAHTLAELPKVYKESKFKIFPIPVFETSPASGQRYGVMPTLLWLDKEEELIGIAVAAFTYNPKVVKWGTFAGLFLYPSPEEAFTLFFEIAQNYVHDYYLKYLNERWLDGRLRGEFDFEYVVNPFERFFGFGPTTPTSNESNFVSRVWWGKAKMGYEIFPKWDLQLEEKWVNFQLRRRALTSLNDTATFFVGEREVRSSNQWVHRLSVVWDTRDNKGMPREGHFVEPFFLLSHQMEGANTFYYGTGLVAKKIFSHGERFTTITHFKLDQVFGDRVPFYMQPSLGGDKDMRGFVWRRFAGRGRLLLDVEERIVVKHWHFMNVNFDLSVDPFFSLGQVFNQWGHIAFSNLQPVGGLGVRAKVPPNIVGRVDVGVSKEGVEVFTGLDYPF